MYSTLIRPPSLYQRVYWIIIKYFQISRKEWDIVLIILNPSINHTMQQNTWDSFVMIGELWRTDWPMSPKSWSCCMQLKNVPTILNKVRESLFQPPGAILSYTPWYILFNSEVTPTPILKMNLAKGKHNDKVVVCHIVIYGD